MFTGYLIHCIKDKEKVQSCCFIEKPEHCDNYIEIFTNYCNLDLFKEKLGLQKTYSTNSFELQSTPSEICTIFIESIRHKFVRNCLTSSKLSVPIKFQTGFKYWEDRERKFYNKRAYIPGSFCTLDFKGKRNYGIVSLQKELNLVMVLEDCKIGMAEPDLRKIVDWVQNVSKPIVNSTNRASKVKLQPLLDILEKQDPFKDYRKF